MPSTRVQSLNHVSVNVAYSMPVQHVLTSTTHPLLGALPSKGEVGSCCSMFLICKDIIILHILVYKDLFISRELYLAPEKSNSTRFRRGNYKLKPVYHTQYLNVR
jgi:hypothetical protein